MASNNRAPKQWSLTDNETLNSFKNWKENLLYTLSLDASFKPYLKPNVTWGKLTTSSPNRGFTDDDNSATNKQTKEEKTATLGSMLGLIANWATVISRNQIVERSVSLKDIWSKIREHYGFHITGSRFLDLTNIRLKGGERPEKLYQTLVSFIDDNLLTTEGDLTHHSAKVEKDEELSPSMENMIVLLWLERIHVNLPGLVKQKYGAELRNKTLASIKPEISQALSSLMEELSAGEESRISRTQTYPNRRNGGAQRYQNNSNNNRSNNNNRFCILCRTANRPGCESHNLAQCRFLPENDRRSLSGGSRIRAVEATEYENQLDNVEDSRNSDYGQSAGDYDAHDENRYSSSPNHYYDANINASSPQQPQFPSIHRRIPSLASIHRRVTTRKSPIMQCFYKHIPVSLCLDTGAEANLVSSLVANRMDLQYSKTKQGALQADEKTPLAVIGEVTNVKIAKGAYVFTLDALIIDSKIEYIVAGEPFLEVNDIAIRPFKHTITIQGHETIPFASSF